MARKKKYTTEDLIGRVILVQWIDSGMGVEGSYERPESLTVYTPVNTIGVLVHQDKDNTVLCHHVSPSTQERDYFVIGTKNITGYIVIESAMVHKEFMYNGK